MYENKDEYKIDDEGYVIYTVPFFKSEIGIGLIVIGSILVFVNFISIFSKGGSFIVFCITLPFCGLVPFLFLAKNLTYIKLSKDYLIVRKRFYCFTKDIIYENSNILEITFEYLRNGIGGHGKGGHNKIKIITKDLDIKSYSMDLYKRRTFFDLKNALISCGVNVIDDLNITQKEFMTFMHK